MYRGSDPLFLKLEGYQGVGPHVARPHPSASACRPNSATAKVAAKIPMQLLKAGFCQLTILLLHHSLGDHEGFSYHHLGGFRQCAFSDIRRLQQRLVRIKLLDLAAYRDSNEIIKGQVILQHHYRPALALLKVRKVKLAKHDIAGLYVHTSSSCGSFHSSMVLAECSDIAFVSWSALSISTTTRACAFINRAYCSGILTTPSLIWASNSIAYITSAPLFGVRPPIHLPRQNVSGV